MVSIHIHIYIYIYDTLIYVLYEYTYTREIEISAPAQALPLRPSPVLSARRPTAAGQGIYICIHINYTMYVRTHYVCTYYILDEWTPAKGFTRGATPNGSGPGHTHIDIYLLYTTYIYTSYIYISMYIYIHKHLLKHSYRGELRCCRRDAQRQRTRAYIYMYTY